MRVLPTHHATRDGGSSKTKGHEMKTKQYVVTGHYAYETEVQQQRFGRLPAGYDGDGEDLDGDDIVSFWLESDEGLVVGGDYGDFIVTSWEDA